MITTKMKVWILSKGEGGVGPQIRTFGSIEMKFRGWVSGDLYLFLKPLYKVEGLSSCQLLYPDLTKEGGSTKVLTKSIFFHVLFMIR